jgi:hypothetical protein
MAGLLKVFVRANIERRKMQRIKDKSSNYALGGLARDIRKEAMKSIKVTKDRPGKINQTVNTRRAKQVKRSIRYWNFRKEVSIVVGPTFSFMGDMMKFHEFGKRRKKQRYPKRPTMGRALERALPKTRKRFNRSFGRRK